MSGLNGFLAEERGQDLIEYTLLLAFVALASAALFMDAGGSLRGIWSGADDILNRAGPSNATPQRP